MKTADIEPGKTYLVRLTEEQSLRYRGCEVRARVRRAGFHYDVTYVKGTMIRGAPISRTQTSAYPNGVEVEWDEQMVWSNRRHINRETVSSGSAIVNARAVQFEVNS